MKENEVENVEKRMIKCHFDEISILNWDEMLKNVEKT